MTYADENLQEQETVNESTPSPNIKADRKENAHQNKKKKKNEEDEED